MIGNVQFMDVFLGIRQIDPVGIRRCDAELSLRKRSVV